MQFVASNVGTDALFVVLLGGVSFGGIVFCHGFCWLRLLLIGRENQIKQLQYIKSIFCAEEKKQRKNAGNLKDSFLRFHENFKNSLKTAVLSSNQKENSEFIFKNFWLKLRHVKRMGFLTQTWRWCSNRHLLEHHSWRRDGVKWDEEKPNISRRSGDF